MCGFVGLINLYANNKININDILINMRDKLIHRGPDDFGIWINEKCNIGFGFRRLAIIDLSINGHQPMSSRSTRYKIVFNGEIYNHVELRSELNKYLINRKLNKIEWKSNSDTETLLECIEFWGIEESLNKSVGMFSLALWDEELQNLYLIRDRLGEKPLYYGWTGEHNNKNFIFGSELKALKSHYLFNNKIDLSSLSLYIEMSYIPAPRSIYENIYKLEPGSMLIINNKCPLFPPNEPIKVGTKFENITIKRWWSLAKKINNNINYSDEKTLIKNLESKLTETIKLQLRADVPVGAFLSSGVDSSTVVAIAQKNSNRKIKTFTIGLEDLSLSESLIARKISKELDTDHYESIIKVKDAQEIIPKIPNIYDEPFADSSQIPTYLVSRIASQEVKVVLSGDGGDEVFGGYDRYMGSINQWKKFSLLPFIFRKKIGKFLNLHEILILNSLNLFGYNSNSFKIIKNIEWKLNNIESLDDLNKYKTTAWLHNNIINDQCKIKNINDNRSEIIEKIKSYSYYENEISKMMYKDTMEYLPDDILCKVDRSSMANSIETRIPLLDHNIVEFSWTLPFNMKIRNNNNKWILKELLYKHVPKDLVNRPKSGFSIPIDEWLRGPLRDWAENLLDINKIKKDDYFNHNEIKRIWHEHINLNINHSSILWTILMFQSWLIDNS